MADACTADGSPRRILPATLQPANPSLSALENEVLPRLAFATRNINISHYGSSVHQTVLKASGNRIRPTINPSQYSDEYALFRFDAGPQTDSGWLVLSLSYPAIGGPNFTITAYTYDMSGQPIPAGSVPEPQNLPLALRALTLGALGLREWRKSRTKPNA